MGRRKLISSDYETSEEEEEKEEETKEEDSDETVPGTEGEDEDDGFYDMFHLDIPGPSNYAPKGRHPLELVKDGDVMPAKGRRASVQDVLDVPMLTQKLEAFAAARVDNDSDTDEEVIPCSTPVAFKKRAAIPITTHKRKASEVAIDSDVDAGGPRSDDEDTPAASAPSPPAAASPPEPRERRRRLAQDQDEGEGEDVGPRWTFECVLVEMDEDFQDEVDAKDLPAVTQAERAESSTSRKTRHPEPSAPACTAAVAMKTGWSLGPLDEVEILDVPGKPTFAELERAAAEERLVSDAILKKYHRLHRPWLDPSVPIEFGGRLGKSTYSWIRHGDEVFKVGDHVFLKTDKDEYEEGMRGAPRFGWVATLLEIRRKDQNPKSSAFPGTCLLQWFEGAKVDWCLGPHGNDRELFQIDCDPDEGFLSSIKGHASVSFSEGPTENADFFCRAIVVFEYDKDGKVLPYPISFVRFEHAEADPLAPLRLEPERKIFDLFSGSGLGGLALDQAGVGKVAWALDHDPVPAATNALNSDARVFNVDANDALRAMAAARGAGAELAFLADNGLADRLGERASAMGYTGSYKVSEFPRRGEAHLFLDTSPCCPHSDNNTCKNDEDPRYHLMATSLSMVELAESPYFASENVMGILRTKLESPTERDPVGRPSKLQAAVLLDQRYSVCIDQMPAVRFGSSQNRTRLATLASKEGYPLWIHPKVTHAVSSDSREIKARLPMAPTISDVISDLQAFDFVIEPDTRALDHCEAYRTGPQNDEQRRLRGNEQEVSLHVTTNYEPNTKRLVIAVPMGAGSNYNDIPRRIRGKDSENLHSAHFGRLGGRDYFKTLTTKANPNSHNGQILHYQQRRTFSLRELARAQGFPDWWILEGTASQIVKQIGNALEYHIAYALGAALVQAIEGVVD